MLALIPLLHTSQTVVSDVPGLTACLAALTLAVGAGGAAGVVSRLRRRTQRRLAITAVSAVALLAVLPSVLPYDHLFPAGHVDAGDAVHASHCHDTPSSCADAPVPSGPGQLIDAAPLLVFPSTIAVLLIAATPVLFGISRRPILRPPQPSVATSI